jgi:hypothetical protein
MALEHLSYSSIALYLDCPTAWRYKYVLNQPTRGTPALVFGTAIHGFIEAQVARQTLAGQPSQTTEWANEVPVPTIAEAWQWQWRKALAKESVDWGLDTPEQHYNEGLRLLTDGKIQDVIAGLRARCDDQGLQIERKIELHVPGVGVPVIGYIDLVTPDGVPCDFKTSSHAWAADKAQTDLQPLFYLAALNQAGCHWHNWRFRHLIFVKTKTPQVQALEHVHRPAEVFFLFRLLREVWTAIQHGIFPPHPMGWRCNPQYCDFWSLCRGRHT